MNLPKPAEMVARLFVLAGHPHNGRDRGEHMLTTMRALCPNLKEDLVELWDMIIPKLLSYLQGMCVFVCVIFKVCMCVCLFLYVYVFIFCTCVHMC